MEQQTAFVFAAGEEETLREILRTRGEAEVREAWKTQWGWDGPKVGGRCEINALLGVERADGGNIYAYGERCIIQEELPGGLFGCKIAMGLDDGRPWRNNGLRVVLGMKDVWPPSPSFGNVRELFGK